MGAAVAGATTQSAKIKLTTNLPLVGRSTRAATASTSGGGPSLRRAPSPTRKMLRIFRPPHKGEVREYASLNIGRVMPYRLKREESSDADSPTRHSVGRRSPQLGERETIALLGPSGSGKSSLLMVAAGLEAASGGRVTIDGTDITCMGEDDL